MRTVVKKRVLVLGGSYFIGRRITEALIQAGYAVTTLNRGSRPAVPGAAEIRCDRDDAGGMRAVLGGARFEFVVDVSGLNRRQAEIFAASARWEGLEKLIFISSSAVYAVDELNAPFAETDSLGPNTYWGDYGTHKIEAEAFYAQAFPETQKVFLRPPYLYGENNYAQRESFVFAHLTAGRPLLIPASNPRLQFLYTGDLAAMVLELLVRDTGPLSIFNVGNREAVTASEWIERCAEAAGLRAEIIPYAYQKDGWGARDFFPFPDYDNVLNVERSLALHLQELNFTAGLRRAFDWYLANRSQIVFKEQVTRNEEKILTALGR